MITWRDKMSVDNGGIIDQDHKHLIDIINQYEEYTADGLDKNEATEIVYALKFYARTHFEREEHLQALIKFPYADAHQHEHKHLIKHLEKLIDDINDPDTDIDHESRTEITVMLRDWLVNHILHSDQKMKNYVEAIQKITADLPPLKDVEYKN